MRKVLFSLLSVLVVASLLTAVSCKKDNPSDTPPASELTTGTITGKVFSQNGTTPIPMATVFVDVNGEIYLTYTDKDGNFSLKAPSGTHTMYLESGRGTIFRTMLSVDVPERGTYTFPSGSLKLQQVADLAYIAGAYDAIEDIIINDLGYTCDPLTIADLDDLTTLQNYAGIFLNCGKSGALDAGKYANLEAFVAGGGSLYASDWAVEYLTGDGYNKKAGPHQITATPKPTCVGELGGFVDDAELCTDKIAPSTMVYGAAIVDPDIQAYMGVTNINIEYDLGGWEQILTLANPPWEVLIQDTTGLYGPLAIRLYYQAPNKSPEQILDQGWVTICHIPPGNPANAHTITISVNALPAHLAHGDYVGACQGSGGTIYYTTFHNHVQGTISPDIQKMLEYFVMNL